MSILSALCPVKVFGYVVKGESGNSVASIVGSALAVTSLPGSVLLLRLGYKEWVKPTVILGIVGTATAILGLENTRICAEKRPEPKTDSSQKDIIEAIEYLATYYWRFWEEKINNESDVMGERIIRPNIPSEFAYAFGHALLRALESKINARYERICDREGDSHPEKWEFRSELGELVLQEKDLWVKAKSIIEEFRVGQKAFNRQKEDLNMSRPLLYCTLLNLLREFHLKYQKVLLESRVKKLSKISQQMRSPALKLPTIPEKFSDKNLSDTATGGRSPEPAKNVASTEDQVVLERRYESAAAANFLSFMGSNDNPVVDRGCTDEPVVDRHEHLCLAEEPSGMRHFQ